MSSLASEATQAEHRAFLNRYYGVARHVYDLTRKYYLFGRDAALRELGAEPWTSLVEVGAGTGRNLRKLQRKRPHASYGALDASDEMLAHLRSRHAFVQCTQGFAEHADLARILDRNPDRVLFSYCLSMVQDPRAALLNAQRSLAPGGVVKVVDFGDFAGLPGPLGRSFRKGWLRLFHVKPLDLGILEALGASVRFGPGRYYFIADLPATRPED